MGRYQLSRKDTKINRRYHDELARKNAAEKIERVKQLKAARLAQGAAAPQAEKKPDAS